MDIVITDNVFGYSGYAKATRELALELAKTENVEIVGTPTGFAPEKIYSLLTEQTSLKDKIVITRPGFRPSIEFAREKPKAIIGIITIEGVPISESFVRLANDDKISQIWAPSSFCKQNYENSGIIEEKIKIVPHGVNSKLFKPLKTEKKYDFLFCGGFSGAGDRKGGDLAIEAFKDPDFANNSLYMKINSSYAPEFSPEKYFKAKNVTYDTKIVTERELVGVYNSAKIFLAPSRAEGFNMTLLEAMSCELPAIATDYGGQTDYLPDNALMLHPTKRAPARFTPWDAQSYWAEPELGELKERMRDALTFSKEIREIGKKNREIAKKWSWQRAGKLAREAMECL
ncbi:MAG: glycosyltransferase family 4 protein [Candidatus Heimdallarchaeota archaeon]